MTAGPQRPPMNWLRTRALLVAIVGGTALLAIHLTAGPNGSVSRAVDPSAWIVQGRFVRAMEPPSSSGHAVLATARRFAGAYLSYEVGRGGGKTVSALATPRLSVVLQATPVRLPRRGGRPARGRLGALRASRAGGDRWQVDVSIWRSGEGTGLTLTVMRRGRRWLVSGLA
jgi:hypothetical protein